MAGARAMSLLGHYVRRLLYGFVSTLKAQMVLCDLACKSLAKDFEAKGITADERSEIYYRWESVTRCNQTLQLISEREERLERRESHITRTSSRRNLSKAR